MWYARPRYAVRLWIGLDDTDHLDGGCTTWSMRQMMLELVRSNTLIVEEYRLVRLWPFAPYRTRGNAALAVKVNTNGNWDSSINSIHRTFNEIVLDRIDDLGPDSSPVCVVAPKQPESAFHFRSVRGLVQAEEARAKLQSVSGIAFHSTVRGDRGVIGAVAAIAWPAKNWTWELTAWRSKNMIGSDRMVPDDAVESMRQQFPSTFLNRDPRQARSIIAPRTPCPVLYGIRSTDSDDLASAHQMLQNIEGVERSIDHVIHRTNQATDDHLICSYMGTVVSSEDVLRGGHSMREVWDGSQVCRVMAFREGGDVNEMLRRTNPGDVIEWYGLLSPDGSYHLERLRIVDPIPKLANRPSCSCGKTVKSSGSGQDLRCPDCGMTMPRRWIAVKRAEEHWAQPPPSSRRHLSRPIELGNTRQDGQD